MTSRLQRIKLPPDEPEVPVGKNAKRDLLIFKTKREFKWSYEDIADAFELSTVRIWQIIAKGDQLLFERDLRIELAA